METVRQLERRWLARGILVAAIAVFTGVAGAQTGGQVAPPPADLEPGVNTSATQTSSADPAAAPATQQKAPQITTKPATTAGRAAGSSAASQSAGATSGSQNTGGTNAPTEPVAGPSGNVPAAAPPAAGAAGTRGAAPKSGAATASTGPAGKAHDSLQLDTTQITGNRELPKVLYIVPWKRSDLGDLVGKPVNSLLDEVLMPVDRDVFKRQNRYYDALKPDAAKDAAGAAAGVTEKH
ncbi:MAG: hypothetical protein ACJ8R9_28660 [Steroidobacteraceae bacterium]